MTVVPTQARRGLPVRPRGIVGPEIGAAALADWLFWDHGVGLSFALFCAGLAIMAHLGRPHRLQRRSALAMLLLVVGLAPAIEDLNLLSVLFALLETAAAAGLALPATPSLPRATLEAATRWVAGPRRFCIDLQRLAPLRWRRDGRRSSRWAGRLTWALPLAAASTFLVLFADANPVIADLLSALPRPTLDPSFEGRVAFWIAVAIVVWPVLRPRRTGRVAQQGARSRPDAIPPALCAVLFSDAAVLRVLVLCNGLFVLQLALDGAYLWGGVALPHGMTYAEYAHRGAYPLVLTALIAGGLVLLIQRKGAGVNGSSAARALLLLFVGQNVLLVGSAARRLGLYVAAYGLTEWRVAAFCWMGLVACGLTLVARQVFARRSNGWLAWRIALIAAAVLYGWSLADVPGSVANYNVAHCQEATGAGPALDVEMLVNLGPSALPALDAVRDHLKGFVFETVRNSWAQEVRRDAGEWRSWTFRAWRLSRWLDSVGVRAPAGQGDHWQAS